MAPKAIHPLLKIQILRHENGIPVVKSSELSKLVKQGVHKKSAPVAPEKKKKTAFNLMNTNISKRQEKEKDFKLSSVERVCSPQNFENQVKRSSLSFLEQTH